MSSQFLLSNETQNQRASYSYVLEDHLRCMLKKKGALHSMLVARS